MANSNLVVFSPTGKILKSINWWFIVIVILSIVGIGFLIYYNWKNIKAWLQKKPSTIDADFSAKVTFDDKSNTLKVAIQSEQKQTLTMRIYDDESQELSSREIVKEEEIDLNILPEGKYRCSISNGNKAVVQIFEKK